MPRPSRCRRVCCEPLVRLFAPQGTEGTEPVVLLVEEYEAIRIVDLEKRTHDQCAQQMQISRTTATEIYEKARFKIADAIVNGKPLVIEGGNYRICQESSCCACPGRCRRNTVARAAAQEIQGVSHMKIAMPVKNDAIFQHFGMAPNFKIYVVQDGAVISTETIAAGGHGHAAVVNLLVKNAVDCVICGGLGPGAVQSLAQANIRLYAGNEGDCDAAVASLIAGTLENNVEAATAGRGHHHCHGHGHEEGGCGCHGHHGHAEEGCGCHGHKQEGECSCGGHCECGKEECDCHGEGRCGCHGHGQHGHGHCGCGKH
jgi:predicted DNA-binding protein (UPF0251 family)/predicted Fe-Mo cluster-binding NifX family protein